MKHSLVSLSLVVLFLISSCRKEPELPNIVIVLADDMGFGDPQVYNSESKIPTPHINDLAKVGMRFTDAHTPSSVCSPTRYGLLTGRYAWRTELNASVLWSWDKPLINTNRRTLPKMLKTKGYHTACIGKWHLGFRWPGKDGHAFINDTLKLGAYNAKGRTKLWKGIDFRKPIGGGPLEAGFDYYFGDDVPNFPPYTFFENNTLLEIPTILKPDSMFGNPGPMVENWDLSLVMPTITKKAVQYIHERSESEQPFFLYFSLTAPHTPIAPTQEFQGKSQAGLYGDFVYEVDHSLRQVIEALEATGEIDNTLIIFTSDNGSPQRNGENMSGKIGSVKAYSHDPSRPWRGMKGDIWEGGHRVPFIASWPKKIPSGSTTKALICLTDIMVTVKNLLETEKTESQEDGIDFSHILLGDTSARGRESIIHHSLSGMFAIRKDNWKLIEGKHSGGFSRNLEIPGIPVETEGQLYDMKADPGEHRNVYADHPEIVEELKTLLQKEKTDQ